MPLTAQERNALAADLAAHLHLTQARVAILLSRYGTRVRDYLASLKGDAEIPLRSCPEYSVQEIRHICQTERAMTVDDILRRRTLITLTGQDSADVRDQVNSILVAAQAGLALS